MTDDGTTLVKEGPEGQRLVYFVSKILQGAERHYQKLEKHAYALVYSARRLRPYFQSRPIIVQTVLPIRQELNKPDLAGLMTAWSIELSKHHISQALADFVVERVKEDVNQDTL